MNRQNLVAARRAIARWNAANKIATRVIYRSHPSAPPVETSTTSRAMLDSSGHPVVFLSEVRGYVHLDCVAAAEGVR